MYNRKRQEYVDAETMNKHLKYCYKYKDVVERTKTPSESFSNKAFIENSLVYFKLTYRKGSRACTYIMRKDGKEEEQKIDGGEAFRILSKYYKVPRFEDRNILGMSASPFTYFNPKYNHKRTKAIGYDLNSAYSFAMLKDMPDTSVPYHAGFIKEGEIGFIEMPKYNSPDEVMLVPKFSGYSLYIFPLIESPFKKFVEVWYKKKLNPATKAKAKNVLNYAVGYLQKVNPFLRATVIGYCNSLIKSLMDSNTLYCNTDSIVSAVPREDFKIGKNLGEWKIEHEGDFAFTDYSYQWNTDLPAYKHIPKSWFKPGWDILVDEIPHCGNKYKYKNYQIMEINYEA